MDQTGMFQPFEKNSSTSSSMPQSICINFSRKENLPEAPENKGPKKQKERSTASPFRTKNIGGD
jgi:hypothetical protein